MEQNLRELPWAKECQDGHRFQQLITKHLVDNNITDAEFSELKRLFEEVKPQIKKIETLEDFMMFSASKGIDYDYN